MMWKFLLRVLIFAVIALGIVVGINYFVDASHVITSRSLEQMARLVLEGNTVAVPENYNERIYQMAVLDQIKEMPETVVIGNSRGMYLGEEVTGYQSLFNHCVSGACIEDYYAIPAMYWQKFGKIPPQVIVEVSPWLLDDGNPEDRWSTLFSYRSAVEGLYQRLNGRKPEVLLGEVDPFNSRGQPFYSRENPWLSLPYFQYNCFTIRQKGLDAFKGDPVRVSTDPAEAAELPDGSLRYPANLENPSPERLARVRAITGPVTFEHADRMTGPGEESTEAFTNLIRYLQDQGTEVILYLAPFSPTQCGYSFDQHLNPAFREAEEFLRGFAEENGIRLIGGFDARRFWLTDEQFSDESHPDKEAVKTVWNSKSL